ncbi:hypothetical protein STEG23_033175 [Scotinomys teguina]
MVMIPRLPKGLGRFSWPRISWKRKRKRAQVQDRKGSQQPLGHKVKEASRMLWGMRSTSGQDIFLSQGAPSRLLGARWNERTGAVARVAIESKRLGCFHTFSNVESGGELLIGKSKGPWSSNIIRSEKDMQMSRRVVKQHQRSEQDKFYRH